MKFHSFFLLSFVFLTSGVMGQTYKVTGTVSDAISGDNLPGVNIIILSKDNETIQTGAATDSTGYFELKNIKGKNLSIKFSMVGYETRIDSINEGSQNLGNVLLSPSAVKLSDVEVSAQKPMLEYTLGKTIINIDKVPGNHASVSDALKNTGLIDVDPQTKKISVRGSAAVTIKIDGHDVPMGDEMLSQMPATFVEKAELSTMPSAKDDPEGTAGILNIITRKAEYDNISGSANIYGLPNSGMGGLMLNYKNKTFSVNSSVFMWGGNFESNSETHRINYNSISLHEGISEFATDANGTYKDYNAGFDYDPDSLNSFSFSAAYYISKHNNNNTGHSANYDINRQHVYDYFSAADQNYNNKGTHLSGFYKRKFNNNGSELTADVFFRLQDNLNTNDQVSHFDYSANIPGYLMTSQAENSKTLVAKLDYVNPDTIYGKFEAGYRLTYRDRKNDYTNKNYLYTTGAWGDSLGLSNLFKYTEAINALYLAYTNKFFIFDIRAGLRLEQTLAEGTQAVTSENFKNDYISVFPSFSIAYSISPLYQVSISAARRINRPGMWQLNPFVIIPGPNYISRGNSRLEPTYTNNYELAFSSLIKVYYSDTKGSVVSFTTVENDSVTVNSYVNASSTKRYGAEINLPITNNQGLPFTLPDWFLMMNLSLSYAYVKEDAGYLSDEYKISKGTFYLTDYVNLKTWYDIYFSMYISYHPESKDERFYTGSYTYAGLYISRNFFDNKLEVGFSIEDMLKSSDNKSETNAPAFYDYNHYWSKYSPNFGISLRYSFNNFQQKQQRDVNDGRDNTGGMF